MLSLQEARRDREKKLRQDGADIPFPGLEALERERNQDEPQLMELPELSLALETESGELLLISGCSHSGIEEIVREAVRATDVEVALVTGGFHLVPYNAEYITQLANTMKDELGVRSVAPTHCTGDEGIAIFEEVFGEYCVKAGLGTRIAFPS